MPSLKTIAAPWNNWPAKGWRTARARSDSAAITAAIAPPYIYKDTARLANNKLQSAYLLRYHTDMSNHKAVKARWGDPGSYSDQHLAAMNLRKPNKCICVCCRAQARLAKQVEHVKGCPAASRKK